MKNTALAWEVRRSHPWRFFRRISVGAPMDAPGRTFYETVLDRRTPGSILDIGANVGSKAEIFMGLAERVIAVEPDPDMANVLSRRFSWRSKVEIVPVAVSAEPGTLQLFKFDGNEAFNTARTSWVDSLLSPEKNHMHLALPPPRAIVVKAVTLASLVERYSPIKYVKVDAEGLELDIISTLKSPLPLLSLEFNLPEFESEFVASIARLEKVDSRYRFNAVITEPPHKFEFEQWMAGGEFINAVRRRQWQYCEVFARL